MYNGKYDKVTNVRTKTINYRDRNKTKPKYMIIHEEKNL